MVVGLVVGGVGGVVGVVGAVCGGGFGMGATATGVGGFVAGEGLVVFGVGVSTNCRRWLKVSEKSVRTVSTDCQYQLRVSRVLVEGQWSASGWWSVGGVLVVSRGSVECQ